jgi:hypothetical protein
MGIQLLPVSTQSHASLRPIENLSGLIPVLNSNGGTHCSFLKLGQKDQDIVLDSKAKVSSLHSGPTRPSCSNSAVLQHLHNTN